MANRLDAAMIATRHSHNALQAMVQEFKIPEILLISDEIHLLLVSIKYILRIMKLLASFILSFALMFAGLANAAQTAIPCHTIGDQHATHAADSDEGSSGAADAHDDHHSDHQKSGGNTHAAKCVSSCCGSLCFVAVQNQFDNMRGKSAYGSSRSTFRVDTFGQVQERPPKFLG